MVAGRAEAEAAAAAAAAAALGAGQRAGEANAAGAQPRRQTHVHVPHTTAACHLSFQPAVAQPSVLSAAGAYVTRNVKPGRQLMQITRVVC